MSLCLNSMFVWFLCICLSYDLLISLPRCQFNLPSSLAFVGILQFSSECASSSLSCLATYFCPILVALSRCLFLPLPRCLDSPRCTVSTSLSDSSPFLSLLRCLSHHLVLLLLLLVKGVVRTNVQQCCRPPLHWAQWSDRYEVQLGIVNVKLWILKQILNCARSWSTGRTNKAFLLDPPSTYCCCSDQSAFRAGRRGLLWSWEECGRILA